MSRNNEELFIAGKILHPLLNRFVTVEAVYHREKDLIFKAIPKTPSEGWDAELQKLALEAGFSLTYIKTGDSLLIVSRDIRPKQRKIPWLNIILFVITALSMITAYNLMQYQTAIFRDFSLMIEGVYFALALLPILLFHEFGHYIAARLHKAHVSLPYFIPAPTAIGTLGAIIKSRSPFRDRRQLFDVGSSGPLAGFVVTVVVLIIGFSTGRPVEIPDLQAGESLIFLGESLIFNFLKVIFVPPIPEGYQLGLSPLIFAGWVGLFVTMINLMPVGQLDGGHIIYALFGKRIQFCLAIGVFAGMIVLGFWWPGWFLWAFLAAVIIKLKHPPTLDDLVPLTKGRIILGWISIILFILTFMPVPLGIFET